jgi:hypothetical protein
MDKLTFRAFSALLFSVCLTVAAGSAAAQTPTILFSGSSSSGSTISGSFHYLQTKKASSPSSGKFDFSGDRTDPYGISYVITTSGVSSTVSRSGPTELTSFILYDETYPKTLQVYVTFTGTTIGILAPTNTACLPNSLPPCAAFMAPLPTATGKFMLTANGSTTTFTISISGCIAEPSPSVAEFASPQSPIHAAPEPVYYAGPAPAPAYYAGSAAYAVSDICQPRPSCCLNRLFCRRSYCLSDR